MRKLTEPVKLAVPIEREGGEAVTEIALRRPTAGDMRGLDTAGVLNMRADEMMEVVSRLGQPFVTREEARQLDYPDLIRLGTEFMNAFFGGPAETPAETP